MTCTLEREGERLAHPRATEERRRNSEFGYSGRSIRTVSRTRTNWSRSSVFTDSLNSLNSGIMSDVYKSGIYMNTRFAREHVVSDRCTATKWHCFWTCDWQFLSACAQEHHIPPTCLPTSLLAASSASFARPNPHSTPVLPPLLRVSLSRSRPSLVFSVLHHNFSSPIFHRSSFYPCFSRSPTFNTKYLTAIYIFLRYSISFNFFLLFQRLN